MSTPADDDEEAPAAVPRRRFVVALLPGARWRDDGRRWVRADGQTWPHRAPEVLRRELAALDRLIPPRPALVRIPLRRGPRHALAGPLRLVASCGSLERRARTWERDARVRPGAVQAAAWSRAKADEARARVAGLRVGVPWGGRVVGKGVGL
jgi:hypothetical protein